MSATHYGLAPGEWKANPDFVPRRDAGGLYTAEVSFTMLDGTWESTGHTAFVRGAAITTLDLAIDPFWGFLYIENVDLQRREGGYVDVRVQAVGQNSSEYDSTRDVTYTLNGTRVEMSILKHPEYIKDTTAETRSWIEAAYSKGHIIRDPRQSGNFDTSVDIFDTTQQKQIGTLTGAEAEWWVRIFDEGERTWMAPTLEWTKETSGLSGLSAADIKDLGLISTPEGPYPDEGTKRNWLKTGATEVKGSNAQTTSLTWEMSPYAPWDAKIYGFNPDNLP